MTTIGQTGPDLRRSLRLSRPLPPLATAIADDPGLLDALPGLQPHPSGQATAFRLRADRQVLDLVADGDARWLLQRPGSDGDRSTIRVDQRGANLEFVADGFSRAAGQEDARLAMAALYQLACNLEASLVTSDAATGTETPISEPEPIQPAEAPPWRTARMPAIAGAAALVAVGVGLLIRRRMAGRTRRVGS